MHLDNRLELHYIHIYVHLLVQSRPNSKTATMIVKSTSRTTIFILMMMMMMMTSVTRVAPSTRVARAEKKISSCIFELQLLEIGYF